MDKREIIDVSILSEPAVLKTDKSSSTAKLILDCHCELGEGVIYDDRNDAVLFTDILGRKFHVVMLNHSNYGECSHHAYNLPKKLGSFGMLDDPPDDCSLALLCAWEDGFQIYDVAKGISLTELSTGEDVNPHKGATRLNDGRVAPEGTRFVCGGYYGGTPGIRMKIFQVEQPKPGTLVHKPLVKGMRVTNSICWSLEGNIMC
jgi:sugar lactone lactonase YvrE